jgi:hypothetical protein
VAAKKRSTKKASSAAAYPVSEMDRDWRAEDDMRTLARAEEIKADKKRFAAAKKCANEEDRGDGKHLR